MIDNNTRKYPRTMKEAFGPYTSDQLASPSTDEPMPVADRIVLAASLIGLLMLAAAAVSGCLPGSGVPV